MNDNMNYSEYNDGKKSIPWNRLFLSLVGIALVIIFVLLFLKFCNKESLTDQLLKAGKEYYEKYPLNLPAEVGQCYKIDVDQLASEDLLNIKDFSGCNKVASYVNVCYMESRNYHYSAILSCEKENTNYGLWKDGVEADILETSDVRFKFLGQQLNRGTKEYYVPKNVSTNAYYTVSPDTNYTNQEDEQTGYKWYIEQSTTTYWNNGQYSSTQPSGYPNKGESKIETKYTETKPNSASYRTIEEKTLYRYKVKARPYKWVCSIPGTNHQQISNTLCQLNTDGFTQFDGKSYYTCDGKTTVEDINQICQDYTEWSTEACETKVSTGVVCESKKGYTYTDTMWKWYKEGSEKRYYPSGSTDVTKENTYFITSPVAGAIKDNSTAKTVYRFYKIAKNGQNTNFEEWKDITDNYVQEEELIEEVNKLGYNVNSLIDIKRLEDIQYKIQMQYRNIEN